MTNFIYYEKYLICFGHHADCNRLYISTGAH